MHDSRILLARRQAPVLFLMALSLTFTFPASAVLHLQEGDAVEFASTRCYDAEGLRAGGFIWSDGLTASSRGDR